MTLARVLLPVSLSLALLAGCASVSTTPVASPAESAAAALTASGNDADAARAWEQIAGDARGSARDRAWLRAADAWRRAGDLTAARRALSQSTRRHLVGEDVVRFDLLSAELLLADGHPSVALPLLEQPEASIPVDERLRWHRLRAQALAAEHRDFELAGETVRLMAAAGSAERSAAARSVERLLAGVPSPELTARSALLPADDPLYPFAARELTRRGLPLPHSLPPAIGVRTNEFPPADVDGYRPPAQLAVLLPLSGTMAAAGTSVRDGILAGYYAETRRRPLLRFYDSAGSADDVRRAANQAQADGAQMLLGPLTREAVDAVFAQGTPTIDVIALNRAQALPVGSASFALTPEEEGLVAADRCLRRGLRRLWIVGQDDDASRRALAAFRDELTAGGGTVVGESQAGGVVGEFGQQLPARLAAAPMPPEAVFLALRAAPARLVAAQLKDSPLAPLPRLSTSLILAGGGTPRLDSELDGIEYPELPWLLGQRADLPDPGAVADEVASARGGAQRLFAFGLDAWKLAAYYDRLRNDPAFVLPGATGMLRVDSLGVVQRDPGWAVFRDGRPQPAPPVVPAP